ncbi:hypothetical protein OB2597_05130 [Pseudooceanicola batsensis HTCC2597]|uniref:SMODS-associated and fused to various effectors domain-containing protein n=1 Tax=Pseudooceanicola batsensis (strain ATCC BAA-863 / DSM 15984 / KCTC 12145 / HTCC2597) TaxID=252305 RepID=A3TSL1_PSEBH|nr:SAVED domain-containing protein [Pseudooceanicola batsensis]EAQ04638.1 hypothetical protein OB2597_05130 [Pseudooceanicola batsensis HTCC2597]
MTEETLGHALTDKKGMGGVTAQDGFDYQMWDGLRRVPGWLANPVFEHLLFEGLEDYEARFFAPHAPEHHVLERYQAKGNDLGPADIREILEGFHAFDERFPQRARLHALVTPRLPPTLQWLGKHTDRVRRARPFYSPFSDIAAVSDAELNRRISGHFDEPLASFIANAVEFSEQNIPDLDGATRAFDTALGEAFPALDPRSSQVKAAFNALIELARGNRGRPLPRNALIDAIEAGLGERLPQPACFPLLMRSDRNESNELALEIDGSPFSGGSARFPQTGQWQDDLVSPLRQAAVWLRRNDQSRIAVQGSYRLTSAMVLGQSLRAAHGFEIEIPTREGVWRTDDHGSAQDASADWKIVMPSTLANGELTVCIGVIRDPSAAISQTAGTSHDAMLVAHLPKAITSGREAQNGVALIKDSVTKTVTSLNPQRVRLYIAGPAAFAVALGHRWNAMPPTQLHEYLADEQRYIPTASI